ncbi:Uncharacterized protein APZ42_016819 [Daphnia magna]|uniref:Uncharacterized protein n=1 Tax=Daphnia magna TaxID=35525 RepID=A0A165A5S9_9CRUS|nr:Uncharacterized protein APZ42_016819 [Daphnia magna]
MVRQISPLLKCSRNVIVQNPSAIMTGESTCFGTFNRIGDEHILPKEVHQAGTCGRQKNKVWNLT